MRALRSAWRKARSLARLGRFEQLWLLPLWLLLGLARALILGVEFRRLAPHLGRSLGPAAWVPLPGAAQQARARQIGRAVRLAARYTPWQSNCFAQAVAARVLLGLYGVPYALFFGVRRAPQASALQAHAWVASGRVQVTGGTGFGEYAVVGCYVAPGCQAPGT